MFRLPEREIGELQQLLQALFFVILGNDKETKEEFLHALASSLSKTYALRTLDACNVKRRHGLVPSRLLTTATTPPAFTATTSLFRRLFMSVQTGCQPRRAAFCVSCPTCRSPNWGWTAAQTESSLHAPSTRFQRWICAAKLMAKESNLSKDQ